MSFIRELGAAERIYCREQTDHGNQTLVQVLIVSKASRIDEAKARQALVQLCRDYTPILGYAIRPSDDQTTLVYTSKDAESIPTDLMSSFKFEQDIDWHEVFENELNLPFDNRNLSRWTMIDGHILIMSVHHAIADGKNLYFIGRQFLSLCLSATNDARPIVVLEPMEQYLFDKYTFDPISDLELKPRASRPDPIVSRTHVRHFSISDQILARLIDQCHTHDIRLNSILTVLTATAYHLACHSTEDRTMKIHMMVNIRPQLNLDFEDAGMFVTVFDCLVHVASPSTPSLWANAIHQHHDLHDRISRKEYIGNCKNDTDLLKMINDNQPFCCDDVQFAFSNLGVLPNTSNNQIEEHYFGVSLVEDRWTSLILVGVGTIHDRLCFTITYNQNKIETTFIDRWIEKIYYLLERM